MKQLNDSPEMSQPVSGDAGFPGLNLCARGTYRLFARHSPIAGARGCCLYGIPHLFPLLCSDSATGPSPLCLSQLITALCPSSPSLFGNHIIVLLPMLTLSVCQEVNYA